MNIRPLYRYRQFFTSLYFESCRSFLSLLFPFDCPGCNKLVPYPEAICECCASALLRIRAPFCKICGTAFPPHWRVKICPDCKAVKPRSTRIRSVYSYEGLVASMVRDAKYRHTARPLNFFAGEMYILAKDQFPSTIQAVVPVPLHRSREWERTYNQAKVLARRIAALLDIPVWSALRKPKKTEAQSSLSGIARRANLQNTFQFHGPRRYKSVLLVDDVVTTGSTLDVCARELRRNGVRRVYAITVARSMLRS